MEVWLFFLSPECEPLYLFRLTQGFELNLCGHLSEVNLFKVALTDHYKSFRSCGCTKTAGDHRWCSLYSWFCSQSRTQASLGYVFHCNLHLDMVFAAFHGAYVLWRWKQDHSICHSLFEVLFSVTMQQWEWWGSSVFWLFSSDPLCSCKATGGRWNSKVACDVIGLW